MLLRYRSAIVGGKFGDGSEAERLPGRTTTPKSSCVTRAGLAIFLLTVVLDGGDLGCLRINFTCK